MPDPVKKTVVKRKNRVTAVKNADGTTTKTRVRRDGTTKKVKTYKGNKTVASKTVKYRKDGTKKKSLTRPGDKTGTIVRRFDKDGKKTGYAPTNRKKVIKKTIKGAAVTAARGAGTLAVMTAAPALSMAAIGGTLAYQVGKELKKAKPIKAMQNAAKWIGKGVKNKIQTGNRKGRTKKKK